MPDILILGAGMVGSVMAIDLAGDDDFDIQIADLKPGALAYAAAHVNQVTGKKIATIPADLSDTETVISLAKDADIVLGALSSIIGYQTLDAIIESGKPYVDISFMPENALELDEKAKANGVTAVVDCGVAPGLSNMLAGYATTYFDNCTNIEIYVGGLPAEPKWPYYYKAAFSPYDVIEEYTRPSRIVENSEIVVREALSEPELIDFDKLASVGKLEAFNTDGLRSIADTLSVPNMKEKTLRYPGHIELMRIFRETGLFSHDEIEVGGKKIRPIDFTSALLFPKWKYEEGEADITVMRVIADGENGGRKSRVVWELYDKYEPETKCTSMARTTAFPATIMARRILAGDLGMTGITGVIVPEMLGQQAGMLDFMIAELGKKGIKVIQSEE